MIANKDAQIFSRLVAVLESQMPGYCGPAFEIRLWQQARWQSGPSPRFSLVLRTRPALHVLASRPNQLALGEQFANGGLEIEGDLFAALDFAEYAVKSLDAGNAPLGARIGLAMLRSWHQATHLGSLLRRHTRDRDQRAISHHYDQPPEFFMPWLGQTMAYSCAYFRRGNETLDEAQENKLDHICRKLRLRPGDRLLDIGCGWGSLVVHAATHYGVFATGITLSKQQAQFACRRISDERLTSKCSIELSDYRDFASPGGLFDKIASVGMVEHVGKRNLPLYFDTARRLLKPGGVFLNHGIVESVEENNSQGPTFIRKYVFPDSDLVTLATTIYQAEQAGFEVRDVENLREHYDRTLHRWVAAIETNREEAVKYVDERTYRIWRLYMAGSAHAFRRGRIAIHQVLLSLSDNGRSGLPLTRDDWSESGQLLQQTA